MRVVIAVALIVGCGGKKEDATPPPAQAVVDDVSPTGLCTTLCTKAIGCAGAAATEIPACVTACVPGNPQQAKVAAMMAMDCPSMMTALQQSQGGGAAPAAGGRAGCNADCRGCAGDGTSCYAVAGGANGIPCEPCCCAPGGGAPVWN